MNYTSQNTVRSSKVYDLEERTFNFARDCRAFCKLLPRNIQNIEDSGQLIRSSGSTAGNYIEANEAISKKDFSHRIKICRKEAKESRLWLRLCDVGKDEKLNDWRNQLMSEAEQLTKIFGSILEKSG